MYSGCLYGRNQLDYFVSKHVPYIPDPTNVSLSVLTQIDMLTMDLDQFGVKAPNINRNSTNGIVWTAVRQH